ncbi:hypothetical protein niasHS_002297 [Heterodera schachtii]|uniref:Amino acid transporter transmembrane domain-containing protein n=1 Tax=Heterodera schachtii TaxID=97005 RepID=A0ABD2KJL6_HETSC
MLDKSDKNQEGYSLVSNSAATVQTAECGRKYRNIEGMGWLVTCLFIVGETAGGGLIAMPMAMVSAGLSGGVLVISLGALLCALTGEQLAENWTILQQRWPEYRSHCRKPYPAMGLRAVGPKFMTFVSVCLNVTQFGTAVVFLLLAAKNIENFLRAYAGVHFSFCQLLLLVAALMLPFTMLKSPKDFWWAVIGAMVTTTVAVSIILFATASDFSVCASAARYPPVTASKFFMSFGTVMFAYGGHGAFPTIQHDMRKPYRFRRSVFCAYLIIFCMYLPVSLLGYLAYGDSLLDSIIPSLQDLILQQAVNILITLHVVLALTIVFNPLNQELEELLNVPQEFGFRRILCRSGMMLAVVAVAETMPNFGVLLDLVGGSTITMMTLVFPTVFNLLLRASHAKHNASVAGPDEKPLTLAEVWHFSPRRRLLLNCAILLFALVGGLAATVSAMNAMLGSELSAPCYVGMFTKLFSNDAISNGMPNLTTNAPQLFCCGQFRNVSRFGHSSQCLSAGLRLIGVTEGHG